MARAIHDQSWGETLTFDLPAGAYADDFFAGQILDLKSDRPIPIYLAAQTEGLDRLAGDVGSMVVEFSSGVGRSAASWRVLDPQIAFGAPVIPMQALIARPRGQGIVLAARRTLKFTVFAAPLLYWGAGVFGAR